MSINMHPRQDRGSYISRYQISDTSWMDGRQAVYFCGMFFVSCFFSLFCFLHSIGVHWLDGSHPSYLEDHIVAIGCECEREVVVGRREGRKEMYVDLGNKRILKRGNKII